MLKLTINFQCFHFLTDICIFSGRWWRGIAKGGGCCVGGNRWRKRTMKQNCAGRESTRLKTKDTNRDFLALKMLVFKKLWRLKTKDIITYRDILAVELFVFIISWRWQGVTRTSSSLRLSDVIARPWMWNMQFLGWRITVNKRYWLQNRIDHIPPIVLWYWFNKWDRAI